MPFLHAAQLSPARLIRACLVLAWALALPSAEVHAQATERARQKQQAESERAALREQIARLKRDMMQTETARNHAADALASSETAISQANLALRELLDEEKQTVARLKALSSEQEKLKLRISGQRSQLAALLRQQHRSGNDDRLRLLLSGGNPNQINRDLHYMGHLSQAQAELIESLQDNLDQVERNKRQAQNAQQELAEIADEQRENQAALKREKIRHAALLAKLSGKLMSQRQEAGEMLRNEQRLSGLVDRLAALIREQRRAELAETARRKAAANEQQKQNAAKKPSDDNGKETRSFPDPIDADENPAPLARQEPGRGGRSRDHVVASSGPAVPFGALRGKLRMPVNGELAARYGGKREEGPSWKGLFIRTAEGAAVKSVAAGQVIFAEWLRGFGNLIIVDHGNQYMTIYGNNQALLKRAGDEVKTGETIASAGNSGGNEQSGLYFEMRHQGRAFDPLGWIAIR